MLQRLVDLFLAAIDLLVRYTDTFSLTVIDELAGSLGGKTAFGEGTGRECMRRTADSITRAEKTFDRLRRLVFRSRGYLTARVLLGLQPDDHGRGSFRRG